MDVVRQWLANKISHKEIGDYLKKTLAGYTIAIYGAGELGELLYDDLNNGSEFEISYFIDKNADFLYYGIDDMKILNLKELSGAAPVEAILITPYQSYSQIVAELNEVLTYHPQMLSLEDIIYGTE